MTLDVIHGVTAVAELKLSGVPALGKSGRHPRRHRRGRIEAAPFGVVGRIRVVIHGVTAVAELKHGRGPATVIVPWRSSTASPPWPN